MFAALIFLQVSLLAYCQFITLLGLYPFNNVQQYSLRERFAECFVNGLLMALPPLGFYFSIEWLMTASLVLYPALLLGEYLTWWHPYLSGSRHGRQQRKARTNTDTIPPRIDLNIAPSIDHCVLQGLMLLTAICTYIYYFSA